MTETLLSLISILMGIVGANLTGLAQRKYSFGLVGNTIAGVFGSILMVKSFGRLGFDPSSIIAGGSTNWILLFLNLVLCFFAGVLSIVLVKKLQTTVNKKTT